MLSNTLSFMRRWVTWQSHNDWDGCHRAGIPRSRLCRKFTAKFYNVKIYNLTSGVNSRDDAPAVDWLVWWATQKDVYFIHTEAAPLFLELCTHHGSWSSLADYARFECKGNKGFFFLPSQVTSKAAVLFITVQYNVTISSHGKIKINNGH